MKTIIIKTKNQIRDMITDCSPLFVFGENRERILSFLKTSVGRWCAVHLVSGVEVGESNVVVAYDGHNGSFHESAYTGGFVLATGRTPARAKRKLVCFLATLERKDVPVERFHLRNLVREGD